MEKKITKAELWFGARLKDLSAEQKLIYHRKLAAECYERKKAAKKQAARVDIMPSQMEELIAQVRELQAQVAKLREAELKNESVAERPYGDLVAGDTFEFKGHEFTKLRDGRAIINDYDEHFMDCPFDNVDNDYDKSIIKFYINDKFLDLLGLVAEDFGGYGISCNLLSKEEYEENSDLIKNFEYFWWLRSGDTSTSNRAYCVNTVGIVNSDCVTYRDGVRPAFDFADDILVCEIKGK